MLAAALAGLPTQNLDMRLYDDTDPGHRLALVGPKGAASREGLEWSSPHGVAGRRWTFQVMATPAYLLAQRTWQAWAVMVAGLLFTSLLGAFLLATSGRAAVVERDVRERTEDLTRTNTILEREIAKRKSAQEETAASLREKESLLQEIHHRVKNNLQVISSLLSIQAEAIRDEKALVAIRESALRVKAMSFIHEMLYESDTLDRVDLRGYIENLVEHLFRSYGATNGHVRRVLDLAPAHVGLDAAIPCGLIATELVSNCLKHAFPDGRVGEVRVMLREPQPGEFVLSVADTGAGPPAAGQIPPKASTGLKLAQSLAHQIGGSFAICRGPEGTTGTLSFREERGRDSKA
jgi:two-component sensor histidine kinase